jgi:hypothetical protein
MASSCPIPRTFVQSSPVNSCWSSPAQSFLVSGPVGTHDHIFVFSRLLSVLKWGYLLEEKRGLTTLVTGEWLCWLSHSLSLSLCEHWLPINLNKVKVIFRPTVSRPACLGVIPTSEPQDQAFITVRQLRVCWCGAISEDRTGSVVCNCCWPWPAQSFSVPSPAGLRTHDHILLS